ncbi:hypothetical protein [Polaromonas hydrogenivorans]|uniref:Uncharacterized protein n=1 Tax=Polaromonas hydrogenivorans TaxID=335476 RepID=A0AAU7LM56_9BURK
MATTLLAACGGGDSSSGQSVAPVTTTPVTTPVTTPPVTTPPVTTPPVDPGTSVGAAPTASGVGISGTAQVGKLLTGIYSYADADNDPQGASAFRWLRNGVAIAGATARTYTLVSADQGNPITFEVTPVSTVVPTTGTPVTSGATAAVTAADVVVAPAAPTASSVAISGTAQVGQLLTGNYTYADANSDPQGASTFRWLRNGVAIAGATARTYTLVGADQGNPITFEVTPVATVTPTNGSPVVSAALNVAPRTVGMKLLVISAVDTAPSYLAALSILDQIGVPYDKIVLTGTPTALQMVAGTLSDGAGNGKYQGIILATGDLAAYNAPTNNYPSAMTAAQWAMLRQYQFDFGVRSATMYTRPAQTIDVNNQPLDLTYGLTSAVETIATDASALTATFTPLGQQAFGYLNTANPISIKGGVYTYPSMPVSSATVPLLQTPDARTIASVHTATQGWQNLAIATDNNPELTHSLLLGYGIVNWVTKGVFLGERKIYLSAQPDDVFIPDELWDPLTKTTPVGNPAFRHRNDGTDYTSLVAWQTALRANPQTAAFRLEVPFNGVGYNTADSNLLNLGELTDTLSPAVRANPNAFRWINHTWDHSSLAPTDPSNPGFVPLTVTGMKQVLQSNHEVATGLRSSPPVTFALYNKNAFIQPDISGLDNPVFWQAAQEFGLRYILMDTSKTYDFRPTLDPVKPNAGFYSTRDTFVPGNPRIFIIPRYPTNLYYNASTPLEWTSEYNYFFGATGVVPPPAGQTSWFGGDSTYEQILDRESEVLVRYMLKYNANSWMFHAANLRDYDGAGPNNKSVLSDLLDAVVTKYKAMYTLPVLSPSQTEIGQIMEARMAYNTAITAGLKGRIVYGPTATIELTNPSTTSVKVPMTGINVGGTTYGGQAVSTLSLTPGGSTTIPLP